MAAPGQQRNAVWRHCYSLIALYIHFVQMSICQAFNFLYSTVLHLVLSTGFCWRTPVHHSEVTNSLFYIQRGTAAVAKNKDLLPATSPFHQVSF